jgi:ubiquinone/menaquinone biosynthesis C-methylase UbiE
MRAISGVRATYDAVASAYDEELGDELDHKPLDRALLTSFVELAANGTIADVGCGPGHVTRFLAARHKPVIGIDLSPRMITIAKRHAPTLAFAVGSMTELPVPDNAWTGAIAFYSIIHFNCDERALACRELARTIRSGGWLLVAFHVDSAEFAAGDMNHITTWFGESVDIDGHFLDPDVVARDVEAAGFTIMSTLIRQPWPDAEYPSRRCYLLAKNRCLAPG